MAMPTLPWLSVIVPALNEGAQIRQTLVELQPLREQGVEIIVVDGGSRDDTAEIARALADQVLLSDRGRARQLNAGAAHARGRVFLFLHADTRLPDAALAAIRGATDADALAWGRFDVRITGSALMLPVIILGGLDSIKGSVIAGLIIGVAESLTRTYQPVYAPWLGANFDVIVPYLIMIVVLMVRPYGLFGTKEVVRV